MRHARALAQGGAEVVDDTLAVLLGHRADAGPEPPAAIFDAEALEGHQRYPGLVQQESADVLRGLEELSPRRLLAVRVDPQRKVDCAGRVDGVDVVARFTQLSNARREGVEALEDRAAHSLHVGRDGRLVVEEAAPTACVVAAGGAEQLRGPGGAAEVGGASGATDKLQKVATPFIDESKIPLDQFEDPGILADHAASMVMKLL